MELGNYLISVTKYSCSGSPSVSKITNFSPKSQKIFENSPKVLAKMQ